MTSPDSDEALMERLEKGDEDALRALHRRYAALVFTVASRVLGPSRAEDVVQDVFVTLWNKHDRFDASRGTFRAWIGRIALHRALNELRRHKGRLAEGEEALAGLVDDGIQPDEAHWLEHRRTALRAAIDALPAAQRQALSLAFFDELTHAQIAAALNTPVGTAKTRIRLALKRLAAVLVVLGAALAIVVARRRGAEREAREARVELALRMVTTSDVVPLRLAPAAGVAPEAHGTYRARAGAPVAVVTTSHLPHLDERREGYVAWVRRGDRWSALGRVPSPDDDRSLLVADADPAAAVPDELRITVVGLGDGLEGAQPGAAVLAWVRPVTEPGDSRP